MKKEIDWSDSKVLECIYYNKKTKKCTSKVCSFNWRKENGECKKLGKLSDMSNK
jgi:hypothetical protein